MKVFFRTWQKQENTDKHTPRLITITITVQKSAGLILLDNLGR